MLISREGGQQQVQCTCVAARVLDLASQILRDMSRFSTWETRIVVKGLVSRCRVEAQVSRLDWVL